MNNAQDQHWEKNTEKAKGEICRVVDGWGWRLTKGVSPRVASRLSKLLGCRVNRDLDATDELRIAGEDLTDESQKRVSNWVQE